MRHWPGMGRMGLLLIWPPPVQMTSVEATAHGWDMPDSPHSPLNHQMKQNDLGRHDGYATKQAGWAIHGKYQRTKPGFLGPLLRALQEWAPGNLSGLISHHHQPYTSTLPPSTHLNLLSLLCCPSTCVSCSPSSEARLTLSD